MKQDYYAWRIWLDAAQMVGTLAIGAYVWWTNRKKVIAKRFVGLEKDMSDRATTNALESMKKELVANCKDHWLRTAATELAITRIDEELKHVPGKADIDDLHSRITDVLSRVSTMDGRLQGIGRAVDLINTHLIDKGDN